MNLLKTLKIKTHWLKAYFTPLAILFSLSFGSVLFYLSWSRSNERSIPPKTISCFEKKNIWNCTRKHLHGKQLKNKQVKDISFTRCFCRSMRLLNVNISYSDFRDSNFRKAFFKNVSFFKVNLFKSYFYGAILEDVVFEDSDLGGSVFNFATLKNAHFKNMDLRSALFIGARFQNVYYDKNTKLPFSKTQARRLGMILKD